MTKQSLYILCDLLEERWPSMDLAAEQLLAHLDAVARSDVQRLRPVFRHRATKLAKASGAARNLDRLVNRLHDYPRMLRKSYGSSRDLFHLVDHSYSQLLHALPPGRVGVFCHDLDTFRSVLEPATERRPVWFRAMTRHILRGFQKAAVVFYSTNAVRGEIERFGLVDPVRLVQARMGVCEEFTAVKPAAEPGVSLLGEWAMREAFVLHVGSCIPRKRIDVLLDVFAAARGRRRELRLVQAGGEWTAAQREQISRLGIESSVTQVRGLTREQLASLYRSAAVVLQPSEAEGFGLPVAEALACGTAVLASDIPVLREVGGDMAAYAPVGDVAAWSEALLSMLDEPAALERPNERTAWASRYSWATHARIIGETYLRLSRGEPVAAPLTTAVAS
ncbi:MAG TPA: glycosyltransferase family 1 protein [Tepidisphaeraceae bacterium]|nr:glycosyltransferase family 1 protein [Tepidisphaeraceae bacterium]